MAARIRYFAGSLNGRIYFRASPSRVYRGIKSNRFDVSFTGGDQYDAPVEEVVLAVHNRLIELKAERLQGRPSSIPSESWIEGTPESLAQMIEEVGT